MAKGIPRRAGDGSFWLKASGQSLSTIAEAGFVEVAFDRTLCLVDGAPLTDSEVRAALSAAKVDPAAPGHPSVEILLHALCLSLPGVNFVGHTHPVMINALTCSVNFVNLFSGRLFPDEIVVLGPAPLLVPYIDPGIPLAREVRKLLEKHQDAYGEPPRWVLMQNHGLIALGQSAQQVLSITAMAVKTARHPDGCVPGGWCSLFECGRRSALSTRGPDEKYREGLINR